MKLANVQTKNDCVALIALALVASIATSGSHLIAQPNLPSGDLKASSSKGNSSLAKVVASTVVLGVKSVDITLHDDQRDKDLECRVHFPETGDTLPLIVFSHGFGANRNAFAAISHHVAQHGYVIVHPSHEDGLGRGGLRSGSNDAKSPTPEPVESAESKSGSRRLSGLLDARGGLAGMMSDPAKVANRVRDVTFVIDDIEQLYRKVPALKGRVDALRIGVGGHSYGAYTAMLIGGVTVDLGGKTGRSFADPRVRCIMPISAQGTGQQGLTESSWANLKRPMLTMTGSRDQGARGQEPDWKKEPFKLSPPGEKYLLFIENANHVSFGGSLGADSAITEVVKAVALTFWQAYLKDDEKAKALLATRDVVKPFEGKAMIESK